MELDLREQQATLPPGIARGVTGLYQHSLADLEAYCKCFLVMIEDLDVICLAEESSGSIQEKAKWATEIAARFDAKVMFTHNDTELVAFPTTYAGLVEMWVAKRV